MIAPYRDTATHTPRPPTDPDAIGASWDAMTEPGHVYEVRVLTKGRAGPLGLRGTPSGYFTDRHAYIDAVRAIRGDDATGVYLTMNPVDPALLTRAPNRLATRAITATRDEEITARRRFLIDIDAANGADESATDDERTTALARRDEIHTFLQEVLGWGPAHVVTSSGNGGGLIFAIDLPNDEQARHLIKRALQALHARFTTPAATVDVANSNAARITRIPGTVTAKGTHTPERPWRRATATYPDATRVVTRAQLEALAALAPVAAGTGGHPTAARRSDAERDTGLPVDTEGECYARLLEEGSPAGQRHHDMTRLVGHYLARGLGTREIAVLLRPWVDRCQPSFPYAQLDAVIRDLAAAEARKQAGQAGRDDTLDQPDGGAAPATISPAVRELIATQRAALADCKAQIAAWQSLFMNDALPRKAQKVLVSFHQKFNTPLGRPLPEATPCTLYASEDDIKAHGLGVSAYKEGLDVLLNLGLLTREKRQKIAIATDGTGSTDDATTMRRGRGRDFYYEWGLNGPAVNAFWQQLPTLTEIAPTERQVKAVEGRKERLASAVAEGRATHEVVAVLKSEVAREHQERGKLTYERDVLAYERDAAREAAEAAARERDQALEAAQRIVRESQRPVAGDAATPARIMCRAGCGSFIKATTWCCDECRERERDLAGDSRLDVNLESPSPAHTVAVINSLNVNLEYPARAPAPTAPTSGAGVVAPLKACAGGCGELTLRGWTCGPCAARVAAWEQGLHIPDRTAMRQEGVHDR